MDVRTQAWRAAGLGPWRAGGSLWGGHECCAGDHEAEGDHPSDDRERADPDRGRGTRECHPGSRRGSRQAEGLCWASAAMTWSRRSSASDKSGSASSSARWCAVTAIGCVGTIAAKRCTSPVRRSRLRVPLGPPRRRSRAGGRTPDEAERRTARRPRRPAARRQFWCRPTWPACFAAACTPDRCPTAGSCPGGSSAPGRDGLFGCGFAATRIGVGTDARSRARRTMWQ